MTEDPGKTITLSACGEVFALVSECDYESARQLKWEIWDGGWKVGAPGHKRYARTRLWTGVWDGKTATRKKPVRVSLHRWILTSAGISGVGFDVVDHINGNGLDCRRTNLRWATFSENRNNVRQLESAGPLYDNADDIRGLPLRDIRHDRCCPAHFKQGDDCFCAGYRENFVLNPAP